MFFSMQDSWGGADPSGKPLIRSDFSWFEWDQANQRPLRKKELWVGFSSDQSEKLPMGEGSSCYQPVVKECDWFILDVTDREFARSPSKVFFVCFFGVFLVKGPLPFPNRFHIQPALWIKRREIQEWEALRATSCSGKTGRKTKNNKLLWVENSRCCQEISVDAAVVAV